MSSISLCMIVKNEEDIISRCLNSIYDAVDEIIIVDTGSIDKTKDIVSKYTKDIYDFEWRDNFSEARNFSFSKATKDYIMWLDADEFITKENKNKLINLKEKINSNIDLITLETHMCLDENNNPKIIARRNRIVKRERNFQWVGFLHEYIEVGCEGCNCYDSDISIIHDKVKCNDNRNLNIYKANISKGNKLSDRDLYYYGKELYYNRLWDEAIEVLDQFIRKDAWEEEIIDALCKIGECYLHKCERIKAREYFYKTFEYGAPRGEILYNTAYSFELENKYDQAIKWYEIILGLELPSDCYQCVNLCCWRFKPHLNLCACYFEINEIQKSYYHHRKCLEINPSNSCVLENDKVFKSLVKNKIIKPQDLGN